MKKYVSTLRVNGVIGSAEFRRTTRRNPPLADPFRRVSEPGTTYGDQISRRLGTAGEPGRRGRGCAVRRRGSGRWLRRRGSVPCGAQTTVMLSRFVVVGGLCAVLSNAAVIILVHHGFTSLIATLLAFGPILIIGYALHSVFTFAAEPSRLTFTRYTLATLANFPIWTAALYIFCDVLRVSVAIVAPATTALVFVWNYLSAAWAFTPATDRMHGSDRGR